MLFLKYLDDLEQERAMEAELVGKPYEFLIDDALVRYEHLYGQPNRGPYFLEDAMVLRGNAAPDTRDHSDTNVQVEGVDESDLIEVDADHLYVLRGSELLIAQAWPAEELSLLSLEAGVGWQSTAYTGGRSTPWPQDPISCQ